jgi:3-hydroxyisobutyrate dehydrogenase-like beta-hydroxyacid dehydrogenase
VKVAFLGTGIMGAPMARNLARAGHPVALWNRTREKAERAAAAIAALRNDRAASHSKDVAMHNDHAATQQCAAARVARDPADAVDGAEVVVTMLADPAAVMAVLEGGGALAAMQRGAVLVDMSTVDPGTSRQLAGAARGRGLGFLDAPVSGSRAPAEEGTLLILAGGDPAELARARPVLEAMGRVLHVGDAGAGASLKLVVNSLGAHMLAGLANALVLAARLGLDPSRALEAIQAGPFRAPVHDRHGGRILDGEFAPDFTLALMRKDQELALAAGSAAGYEMPTLGAIVEVIRAATEDGHGGEDLAALVRRFEALAGVQ